MPRQRVQIIIADDSDSEGSLVDLGCPSTQQGKKRKSPDEALGRGRGRGKGRVRGSGSGRGSNKNQDNTIDKTNQRQNTHKKKNLVANTTSRRTTRQRRRVANISKNVESLESSVDVLLLSGIEDEEDTTSSTSTSSSSSRDDTSSPDDISLLSSSNIEVVHRNKEEAEINNDSKTNLVDKDEILIEEKNVPLLGFNPNISFSDSDEDLYSVNHNAIKAFAQATAKQTMDDYQAEQRRQRPPQTARHRDDSNDEDNNCSVYDLYQEDDDDVIIDCDGYKSDGSRNSSPEVSNIKLSARKIVKMSKRTLQLLEKADKMQDITEKDESMNQSIIEFTEEELNPVLSVSVRYGLSISKFSMKQHDKFGVLYALLAQKHGVEFDQIVLSLRDDVLPSDYTPAIVKLSIVDIIECGIMRKSTASADDKTEEPCDGGETPSDPNMIILKLQCSARRGIVFIAINKFEKIIAVMQKYAQKKGEDLGKLRFMFDGEKLDPNETPITLDLEGGECIDVYPV